MRCKTKKLLILLISVIILLVSLTPYSVCYAHYYDNTYPVDIGFESGLYIRCKTNLSDKTTILLTQDAVDCLALRSNLQLYNISGSAVYGLVYFGGTQYRVSFASGGSQRVHNYDVQNSTTAFTIQQIIDTNIDFPFINPNNPSANNNLYFSKFEIAVVSLLIAQLFFILMGWFLLHRKL